MSELITCPSGLLSGEIRGLQGKNLAILDDKKAVQSGEFLDKVMRHCWVRSENQGPYPDDKSGALDWSRVLTGDRLYALIRVRCLMRGEMYSFEADCHRTNECKPFDVNVNLIQDLEVKQLAEEDRKAFLADNRLEAELPDGRKFWFMLPTGATEVKVASFGKAAKNLIPALCTRILEIEGVEEGGIRSYFEEGDLNLPFDAIAAMAEHDCGVETGISVVCPQCGGSRDMEIPFDRDFLVSTPKRRK